MNIFVTVGFENFPFDRLIRAVDEGVARGIVPDRLMMQIGHSNYIPRFCPSQRFLRFDKLVDYISQATIIICHAGVGTTLLSWRVGKIPLLFPRQARFGEHVDDHQICFARQMDALKKALTAYDEAELMVKIKNYESLVQGIPFVPRRESSTALGQYLQRYLMEVNKAR